jgi:hypothetical protein
MPATGLYVVTMFLRSPVADGAIDGNHGSFIVDQVPQSLLQDTESRLKKALRSLRRMAEKTCSVLPSKLHIINVTVPSIGKWLQIDFR